MRSNPYVYPYTPFKDLADKTTRWQLGQTKTLEATGVKTLLEGLPKIEVTPDGAAVAEKILSIFLDPEILFGPAEYILDLKAEWLAKFDGFVAKDEPMQFTLLGFPFKVPVKLKTDRVLPDMGELLILHRLNAIAELIRSVHAPGAVITIFTEGAFGPFVGLDKSKADAYAQALAKMVDGFGYSGTVKVRALAEMERAVPDFAERFETKLAELTAKHAAGDPDFMKKFDGAQESIYRIVATDKFDDNDLMDAYNEALSDENLPAKASAIRQDIRKRTVEAVLKYHAYLEVRDDIGFLQRAVPDGLALTVSPKPQRLGIIPVNRRSERLPYHGVALYDRQVGDFTIEYLMDLKRDARKFTPVGLEGDSDAAPFFYEV